MNRPAIHFMSAVSKWTRPALLIAVIAAGALTYSIWLPSIRNGVRVVIAGFRSGGTGIDAEPESTDPHEGHDHAGHSGQHEETSLELSDKARRNIGLTNDRIRPIRLQTFRKTITVPAAVVEQPGRTRVQVATPMTGAITHVHVVEGEAVQPGTLLFRIQLTHEDLVQAQTNFVKTLGELDVEENEIARLKEITKSGAVPGRLLLEREYSKEKLTALLKAQHESLKLHGLSDPQVMKISKTRRLLGELQMFAPSPDDHSGDEMRLTRQPVQPAAFSIEKSAHNHEAPAAEKGDVGTPLILQELNVHKGQSVDAGDTLCVLADLRRLYIEGMAFESDIGVLRQASRQRWKVSAIFGQTDAPSGRVDELEIAWLANEVHAESRTLQFYIELPNQIIDDRQREGARFINWMYSPGQRLQLQVPVEEWSNRIVLPVDAVANEGAECFVFLENGKQFERVPVHVEYRDQYSVVIANDGTLSPGDAVATSGAHQMQMALKNKAGGGPDPHAGHSH